MKSLTAISHEELARVLDRVQHGQDIERRPRQPNALAEYFRERNRLRDRISLYLCDSGVLQAKS